MASSLAQIPYYGTTVSKHHLYAYTSYKFRPNIDDQYTYSTLQYGISSWLALGMDYMTGPSQSNIGYSIRVGRKFNPWLSAGLQVTPSFDMNEGHEWTCNTTGLYLNGNITRDGKLFWVSNTWHTASRHADASIVQWWYLASSLPLTKYSSLWPHVGLGHSWLFDRNANLALGLYFVCRRFGVYLWGDDFFAVNARITVGLEYVF